MPRRCRSKGEMHFTKLPSPGRESEDGGATPRPRSWRSRQPSSRPPNLCGDPGLPPGIPVMHTIHDPRKTVMNPHNRAGITGYIIHYITSSNSLIWPLGRIQMPCRASSLSIAAETKVASVARIVPLPYRRLTGRRILVRTGVVELLTIIIVIFTVI
jgi:hypothetical protein